jgi:hypothetical protein
MALGYGLDDQGFESRQGVGIFLFATATRLALGPPTQSPFLWVPGVLSLGIKWPGRETGHSPLCSAEVKTDWIYTSLSLYDFMTWCSVKKGTGTTLLLWRQNDHRWHYLPPSCYNHRLVTLYTYLRDTFKHERVTLEGIDKYKITPVLN